VKLTNNLRLPEAIVRAVANDEYTRGDADFSVTGLISPPKVLQLHRRHDDELVIDVADQMPSLMGQLGHTLFERAAKLAPLPGVLPEERFFISRTLPSGREVRISGQMDHVLVDPDGNELSDYKFPSVTSLARKLKHGMDEWIAQINLYALILAENSVDVDSARVIATGLGWLIGNAERDPSYPQQQTLVIPIELWPREQTETYLMQRIAAHVDAETIEDDDMLPACTRDERWVAPTKFAVMKPNRKSAVRVLDTRTEAEFIMNGNADWWIDERVGGSRRCVHWCAAGKAGLCQQWNAERATRDAAGLPAEVDEAALT